MRAFVAAAVAGAWLAACPVTRGAATRSPPAAKDVQEALAAVRGVALDKDQPDESRAHAVVACARLLIWRGRHGEAIKFCREVLAAPQKAAVIDAALRAGCLVVRDRHGHLRAERDFLASCSKGTATSAASAIRRELERAAKALASLAGRTMLPSPVAVRVPSWAVGGPGKPPAALRAKLPSLAPPSWLDRAAFPPLKPPKE